MLREATSGLKCAQGFRRSSTIIDDELIADALADIDASAERTRAEQLVADKLRRERLSDDTDDTKVARRLVAMLARRGYGQSMAFDVVKVALAGERERRRV
jgi:regulatory protein